MAKPFPLRRFQNDSYPPPPFRQLRRIIAGSRLSPAVQYRWRENAERARRAGARVPFDVDRNSAVTDNRPMGAGPRILVVDDNDDNRYTLKLHLDLEGYTDVTTARDGEEAIALLETSAFDLVLLDVMMPKVDGFQVLAWLKDQARLRDLPVIMISALTEMNSMARCIELGAVDYLLKPFNPILLKARLGATLEKKRLRDEINAHLARLQEELDAARRLQMAMVPQSFPAPSPDFPIDLCASMEPAREVGGDLYDFFVTEDGMLSFLVGDMMFVTLFFAMLGPGSGELEFCNAGHNAPYRLNGQGLELIEGAKGIILGVRPDAVYTTGRTSLAPGESIYVFTDGVTEAANQQGELFAEARLEAVLRAAGGCSTAAEIVTSVAEAVRGFVGNALPSDDITMLAVRRLDGAAL